MSEFVSLPLALAAEQFAKLPGIGIKTAQRLAYYLLNLPENEVCELADNLVKARMQEDAFIFHGDYLKMIDEIKGE